MLLDTFLESRIFIRASGLNFQPKAGRIHEQKAVSDSERLAKSFRPAEVGTHEHLREEKYHAEKQIENQTDAGGSWL